MNKAMEAVSIARRNLVLDHPFFGVLSLKLEVIEDGSVKTLCTDGRKLKFNPDYVESLSSHELVGAMAHEVLHCANGHTWRRGHRDAKVWNHACDYAINPIVLDAGMVLPKGVLDGSPYKGMPAEEIYERISQQSGQGGEGEGQQADGCGEVVDCGVDQLPEIQAEWLAAVLNAARQASAMGRLPAGMERVVEEIKNPPQDWRAILRRLLGLVFVIVATAILLTAAADGYVRWLSKGRVYNSISAVDRKSTRLNSSHAELSRMPSSA